MKLELQRSTFALNTPFRISRGVQTDVEVLTVTITDGACTGQGETVGVDYRHETLDLLERQVAAVADAVEEGASRTDLLQLMGPGGARNAVDCALWDLQAKRSGRGAWQAAGLAAPAPVPVTVTLSLDTPVRMAEAARNARPYSALKLKLGEGDEDIARVAAVRSAAPDAVLLCDVNEAWTFDQLCRYTPDLQSLGLRFIEQPLKAGEDAALAGYDSTITLCADESCFDRADLPLVCQRYDAINIKLEKTGGLTEALLLARAAQALGLKVMAGCMVSTSLSIAPALLLSHVGLWFDLDGPTYLTHDRVPAIRFADGVAFPPDPALWG